jgi:hypothetical protein
MSGTGSWFKIRVCCQKFVGLYICLFSKQLPHIFISKLLKTFQNTSFIIKDYIHSTYTKKCKSWTRHVFRYKRWQKIWYFLYTSLFCTTLFVSDTLSESSSLVSNEKSSDSSEYITFRLLYLKLWSFLFL